MFWSDEDCDEAKYYPLCQTGVWLLPCDQDLTYFDFLDACIDIKGPVNGLEAAALCESNGGRMV